MMESLLHYEIIDKLGEGGMGLVYLAEDTKLKRKVALKFLPHHISFEPEERERFRHEAQAAAVLNHPNIAQVYAIEESDDELFIVMEYVEGRELKEVIKTEEFNPEDKHEIALQIAGGIKAAHENGIIHRDIKSGNIMIDSRGDAKIMDFGLARIEGSAHITKAGTTIGTTAYMSPEQLQGAEVDKRSDIWAYGVVLYELFTGELPFKGAYEPAIMYAIAEEEPLPATEVAPTVPEQIGAVINGCLEKDREVRYQDIGEVLDDLKQKKIQKTKLNTKSSRQAITSNLYIILPIVLLLLLLIVYPISKFSGWDWSGSAALPKEQGLAILPFKNIGLAGAANIEVVSDGLLETLTSKLAQVDNYKGALWIIPAMEVIQVGITSPSQARKEFSVNIVVTGSLQELDDRVLFTMNLVDAKTLRQISSREVESNKDSLGALQAKAGIALLNMLNIELKPEIDHALAFDKSGEPVAMQFYLRGRGYLLRYEKGNNLNDAIEAFGQAIEEDPDYALAYAGLGESYWRKYVHTDNTEYVEQAKAALDRAVEINPELVPVIATLGLINRGTGKYEDAIKNFRRVITLQPNNDMAFRELAGIYVDQGALDKAEENYKIAIQLKPDYWKGYNDLGRFYLRYRGEIDKALKQYEKLLQVAPDNYIGFSHLGAIYLYKGKFERATELLKKSLEIKETYFGASNLGVVYHNQQNFPEAIRLYSLAHKLNPNSYVVIGNLASAHEQVGNDDLAKDYYRKAIDIAENQLDVNPNNVQIINDLGTYYADIEENTLALKYLNRSIELDSNNTDMLYRVATAYERMGDRENALKWMEMAIEKGYPIMDIFNQPELQELIEDERFKKFKNKIAEQSQ